MATSRSSPRPSRRKPRLDRLVSGGQTGVDRGALDAALAHDVPCGGWCPKGRRAEDGVIPARYPLTECPSRAYKVRTELNVRDSDATLILTDGKPPTGGTLATIRFAEGQRKPHMIVPVDSDPRAIARWLVETRCHILNVAGPRESKSPGIQDRARRFVEELLAFCRDSQQKTIRDGKFHHGGKKKLRHNPLRPLGGGRGWRAKRSTRFAS